MCTFDNFHTLMLASSLNELFPFYAYFITMRYKLNFPLRCSFFVFSAKTNLPFYILYFLDNSSIAFRLVLLPIFLFFFSTSWIMSPCIGWVFNTPVTITAPISYCLISISWEKTSNDTSTGKKKKYICAVSSMQAIKTL